MWRTARTIQIGQHNNAIMFDGSLMVDRHPASHTILGTEWTIHCKVFNAVLHVGGSRMPFWMFRLNVYVLNLNSINCWSNCLKNLPVLNMPKMLERNWEGSHAASVRLKCALLSWNGPLMATVNCGGRKYKNADRGIRIQSWQPQANSGTTTYHLAG